MLKVKIVMTFISLLKIKEEEEVVIKMMKSTKKLKLKKINRLGLKECAQLMCFLLQNSRKLID